MNTITTMKNTTAQTGQAGQINDKQLTQFIAAALEILKKDRDRVVVARRHGVAGYPTATLESIGQELGITRERVRQIEKAALNRMSVADSVDPQLSNPVVAILANTGGIITFANLIDQLKVDQNSAPSLSFLLKLEPQVELLRENDDHLALVTDAKKYPVKDVIAVHRGLIEAAKKQGGPAKFEALVKHIDGIHSTDALLQLGQASKLLVDFEDRWGLASWPEVNPKSIRDKAYLVLKHDARPMHFSEIAKAVTQIKPNAKQVTTQAVHNELIKDKRFVLIGRGIYALQEWGYTPGTVADIITEILQANSPLAKDEIVRQVLLKRQVKPTTIVLNLQEKSQFERVGKATYRLKETS